MKIDNKKITFESIFKIITSGLDITIKQFDNAVNSYQAVGNWLSQINSPLAPYNCEILPQGSFLFGTLIRPINNDDDIDVDLVCKLEGKDPDWTQRDLKNIVGNRIKESDLYKKILDIEGRRCWTLKYSESSNFHMDILPSIANKNYRILLEKALNTSDFVKIDNLSIRITDRQDDNYNYETNTNNWLKSNPFGYASWFQSKCKTELLEENFIQKSINPIPKFQKNKSPLQRVVQILKRHRDIMFKGDEDKPISIIITTLAARAYNREMNIFDAITNTVNRMSNYIEDRYDKERNGNIKWIPNPVNEEENFADKWAEKSQKERNFFLWLDKIKHDINQSKDAQDLSTINKSLSPVLGQQLMENSIEKIKQGALIGTSTSVLTGKLTDKSELELPIRPPKQKREGFQY